MSRNSVRIAVVSVLLLSGQLLGHHSFTSEFNPNQIRTIHGTIAQVSWKNPHVTLEIVTKDGLGKPIVWKVVGDSPATLMRKGAIKKTFAYDQQVTVCGYLARNQANGPHMAGEQVEFPSGERFLFSTTDIKTCYPLTASPTPIDPMPNPVGVIANPVAPSGSPIGAAGNPVGPFVLPGR